MTRDDIIRMAKEAGIRLMGDGFGKPDRTDVWATQDEFECFAALVAAAKEKEVLDRLAPVISNAVSKAIIAEREACAKEISNEINDEIEDEAYCILVALLARIRARGQE